jgi:hypothetical protein
LIAEPGSKEDFCAVDSSLETAIEIRLGTARQLPQQSFNENSLRTGFYAMARIIAQ